jgi:hypothetical protein
MEYRVTVTDLASGRTETITTDAESAREAALDAAETPIELWVSGSTASQSNRS